MELCLQMQTVPYLVDNPEVGYVQARWVFANPDESYLTKVLSCMPFGLLSLPEAESLPDEFRAFSSVITEV